MTQGEGSALTEEEYARVLHWLTRLCGRCESCRGIEWELDRELYALPGFRCEQVLPMVLVVCKTCRNSRLFHVLAAGLVWRGDDAGQEIVRQALPPPPGVLPRLIDTWKRIVAYLRQD